MPPERKFGAEELRLLERVLASGTLNPTKGWAVRQLEDEFAGRLGAARALACGSGTAAVHTAVAAVDPEPGEEIVTSPLTDFGAIAPILQQGAIPVFADVDPVTGTITPASVERVMSERTRAVIVTHLNGAAVDVPAFARLGVSVIEDCAQAFLARRPEGLVGTLGAIGCFSLQQTKHITTGEGGLVVTSDDALAARMHAFVNKARRYTDPVPDHHFLAPNHRMTELQGAVAIPQLARLDGIVTRRRALAERLSTALAELDAVETLGDDHREGHSWWKYTFRVRDEDGGGAAGAVAAALGERGFAAAHPAHVPAFSWTAIRERRTFGSSQWPFTLARPEALDHAPERFSGLADHLAATVALPWSEDLGEDGVDAIAATVAVALGRARAPRAPVAH